jgi:hypothetical protein
MLIRQGSSVDVMPLSMLLAFVGSLAAGLVLWALIFVVAHALSG